MANIAHGHQQVNNGLSRVGETESEQTKVLEQTDGERLDPGATGAAGRTDSPLEAVGAVTGPRTAEGKARVAQNAYKGSDSGRSAARARNAQRAGDSTSYLQLRYPNCATQAAHIARTSTRN